MQMRPIGRLRGAQLFRVFAEIGEQALLLHRTAFVRTVLRSGVGYELRIARCHSVVDATPGLLYGGERETELVGKVRVGEAIQRVEQKALPTATIREVSLTGSSTTTA